MAQVFDFSSKIMAGGIPPLTSASAGVEICQKVPVTLSTLAVGETVALCKIPGDHELSDIKVTIASGDIAGTALTFDAGVFATDVNTSSTISNAFAVTVIDGGTVNSAQFVQGVNLGNFGDATYTPTIKASEHTVGLCIQTAAQTMTGGPMVCYVKYRPVCSWETATTVGD